MNSLGKVISSKIAAGARLVKILFSGSDDVREVRDAAPFGIDSNPVKDMIAVYAPTMEKGKAVVIGYVNKKALAEVGETRLYSTNAAGAEQFYIWLKADGTAEVGGTGDFMVRYNALETAFNDLLGDHNDLVSAFNAHTHPTAAVGPVSIPTPVPGSIPAIPSTADISSAKITEIKTSAATP